MTSEESEIRGRAMNWPKPDAPMDHKCEYCDQVATLCIYMENVARGFRAYRYFCPDCYVDSYVYHFLAGHKGVKL